MNQQTNVPAKADNPFGSAPSVAAGNAVAAADVERAVQEVQAALVIAKKFPRDPMEAMERILNACTRPTLAEGALYSFPRGGQEVTGPTIRLAECLAQEWGNMQFGIRELSQENGFSTVEAFAWDVQSNTRQTKTFQVPHQRYSRNAGLTRLTDPRDIYEMIANQGARRLRACILGVIPGDVTEQAVKQCDVTQASTIEVTPETIKSMLDAFEEQYGVTQELVEKRLGRRAEAINAPQMLNLRKIFQSLKDGMSKPSDWFEIEVVQETVGAASSDLEVVPDKPKKKAPAKKKPAPKAKEEPAKEEEPGEEKPSAVSQMTYAMVADVIHKAASPLALEHSVRPLLAAFLGEEANTGFTEELETLFSKRAGELEEAAGE